MRGTAGAGAITPRLLSFWFLAMAVLLFCRGQAAVGLAGFGDQGAADGCGGLSDARWRNGENGVCRVRDL